MLELPGHHIEFIHVYAYTPEGLARQLQQSTKPPIERPRLVQIRAWRAEPPICTYAQLRAIAPPSIVWLEIPQKRRELRAEGAAAAETLAVLFRIKLEEERRGRHALERQVARRRLFDAALKADQGFGGKYSSREAELTDVTLSAYAEPPVHPSTIHRWFKSAGWKTKRPLLKLLRDFPQRPADS